MVRYRNSMRLRMPLPWHMISPETEAGRAMMRERHAQEASRAFVGQPIATSHGDSRPWPGELVPAGARRVAALAESLGMQVRIDETLHGCVVSAHGVTPRRFGFRARWAKGRFVEASWHEPLRYEMIEDRRPVGMDARSRVGKKGFRSAGQGAHRLSLVATPAGVALGMRELEARLGGLLGDVRVE